MDQAARKDSLFAQINKKTQAQTAWDVFDRPLIARQIAKKTEIPEGDWTENWFFQGNHKYEHLSAPICAVDKCELKDVVDTLNKYGVHPHQKDPFKPGKPYRADVDIFGPWGKDHITSKAIYNSEGQQIGIRNTTEPDHKLHPGVAERKIVERDGFYHILTQGGGYGTMGGPNIWLDELLWQSIDAPVIEKFKKSSE